VKKEFLYSILQYRHSVLINEAINLGILFLFPNDKVSYFEIGDISRVKKAYPDFDSVLIEKILNNIKSKVVKEHAGLFNPYDLFTDLNVFKDSLLRKDDSSLYFLPIKTSVYPFDKTSKIVEQYSKLLLITLSGYDNRKRHDEGFIKRKYLNKILEKDKTSIIALRKDVSVSSNGAKLEFDFSWKNGHLNLVKSVSFDYLDGRDIQLKAITYFGYLTKLKEYAEINKLSYHLLVSKPQDERLSEDYEEALYNIKSAQSPTRIIPEESLDSYSEETANGLRSHINDELQ
jgi:Protein of unknown function (DUF3037)